MLTSLRRLHRVDQKYILSIRSAVTEASEAIQAHNYYDEDADYMLNRVFRGPSQRKPIKRAPTQPPSTPVQDSILKPKTPPTMPKIRGEPVIQKAIREHNTSVFDLKGQVIIGEVKAVGKKEIVVDLGWKNYQTFFKKEISHSQLYTSGTNTSKKRRADEIRPGDELHFRIEEVDTPYGEMFVSTQKMRADIRRQLVWDELKRAFEEGRYVTGRTLNPCNAGYAIGIAGFVAFCPLGRLSSIAERRIGVLHEFMIVKISDIVGEDLLVADASVKQVGGYRSFVGQ